MPQTPASGEISFEDLNDSISGRSTQQELDLQTVANHYGDSAPHSMNEFYGLEGDSPGFSTFTVTPHPTIQGRIDIAWSITGNVTSFVLKRAKDIDGGELDNGTGALTTIVSNTDGAGSPFSDTGLSNDATYTDQGGSSVPNLGQWYYQATATNGDVANGDTDSSVENGIILPDTPTITATANSSVGGRIDISWDNPLTTLGTVTGVQLFRSSNSDMSSLDNSGNPIYSGTGTSFSDTGLGDNTQKYYQLSASNGTGGVSSNKDDATTISSNIRVLRSVFSYQAESDSGAGSYNTTIRGYDSILAAIEETIPSAGLSDFDPADQSDVNEASISQNGTTNPSTKIFLGSYVNGNTVRNLSDNSLFDGDSRYWRNNSDTKVHQINGSGVISNTTNFVPTAPTSITENSVADNSITVTVVGANAAAKDYRWLLSPNANSQNNTTTSVSAGHQRTFTGLDTGTAYTIQVRAENTEGASAYVSRVSTTTGTAPTSVAASPNTLSGDGTLSATPEVIAQVVTVTVTNPSGTTNIYVNNASNTRYKQATTSGGLSSASFTTPSTNQTAQSLTLNGSNQVFLQFEITNTSFLFNRTYTVKNNGETATIGVSETEK
jgi:hypothetical protein